MIRTIHSNRLVDGQALEDLAKISDTGNSEIIRKDNGRFLKEKITTDFIEEGEQNKFLTPEKEDLILTSENIKNKGKPNGYAGLDESGKVPSSQLPGFIDDVLEFENLEEFPDVGEKGKLYVNTQNNKTYRWSGNQYIEIVSTIGTWKGNFSENENYIVNDKVFYNGSCYIALKNTTGNLPTNNDFWNLFSSKGDRGEKGDAFKYSDFTQEQLEGLRGPQGIQGEKGEQGIQGPQGVRGEVGPVGPPGRDGIGTGDMLKSENLHGLTNLEEARNNLNVYSKNEIENKLENLDTKVDVEPGKGLSEQNFTLAEKQKLSELQNFSKDYNDLINKPGSFLTEEERKKSKLLEYMNFMTIKYSPRIEDIIYIIVQDIGNVDEDILGFNFFKYFSFLGINTSINLSTIKKIIQYDTEKRLYSTVLYSINYSFNEIKRASSGVYTEELKDFIFSEEFLDYVLDSVKNNGREIGEYNTEFIFKLLNEGNYPQKLKNKIYNSDLFYTIEPLETNNKDGYILSNFDYDRNPNYQHSRFLNSSIVYNSLINLDKTFEKIKINSTSEDITNKVFKFMYPFLNDSSKTLENRISILKKWVNFNWFKIRNSWNIRPEENINIVIHKFYYNNLENISKEEVEAMYNLLKNSSKNPHRYDTSIYSYDYDNFYGFINSWEKIIKMKIPINQKIELLWSGNSYDSSMGEDMKNDFNLLSTEEKKGFINQNISNVKFVNWLTRFSEVKNFLMSQNDYFQGIRGQLYSTITNNLNYFNKTTDAKNTNSSIDKGGNNSFVFAHLGNWSTDIGRGTTLTHSNGTQAGFRNGQYGAGDVNGSNGVVTFNGYSVTGYGYWYINVEIYQSKDNI